MNGRDMAGARGHGVPERRSTSTFCTCGNVHRFRWQAQVSSGLVLSALIAGALPAKAAEPSSSQSAEQSVTPDAEAKKKAHAKDRSDNSKQSPSSAESQAMGSAPSAQPQPMDSAARARALDKVYGYKGYDMPFPSFADTLTRDDGDWRTKLASYGFGFQAQIIPITQTNILNTPNRIPSNVLPCAPASLDYNCAGGRSYFGQRPSLYDSNLAFLTYDTSRWGVPDGQIAVGAHWGATTDTAYSPDTVRFHVFSWYQTFFDKKLEIKAGYFPSLTEFMGTFVGGNVTNPFGPSGFMPITMGMSPNNIGTPNFRATWHITDPLYWETGIQRSMPVNGPTRNPLYDEVTASSTGLDFNSPVPGTGVLYTNEVGYKRQATPQSPSAWLRAGVLYNTSSFTDYSRILANPAATKDGAVGYYLLGDYQVWQQAPSSPYTAYRGVYIGGTFMYGQPEIVVFPQYYEARAYWYGPFDSRSEDFMSLIFNYNVSSKYIRGVTDITSQYTNLFANSYANSITASYTFHVRPGVYTSVGLQYTDHPSIQYFKGEGSALNFLLSMFITL